MRRTDQRRAAVFICYRADVTGASVAELVEHGVAASEDGRRTPATAFTRELAEGVQRELGELDRLISEQAIGWTLERIAPLERAILRVALFELLHRPDVPDEVAIDEAIESTKLYCGAEAPPFVNGILGGVLRRISPEAPAGKRTAGAGRPDAPAGKPDPVEGARKERGG